MVVNSCVIIPLLIALIVSQVNITSSKVMVYCLNLLLQVFVIATYCGNPYLMCIK